MTENPYEKLFITGPRGKGKAAYLEEIIEKHGLTKEQLDDAVKDLKRWEERMKKHEREYEVRCKSCNNLIAYSPYALRLGNEPSDYTCVQCAKTTHPRVL